MAREFFCAYHSYRKSMRNLSDAECGRLFKALLEYSETGETLINLQGRESIAYDFIVTQIDRDNEAYEEKCKTNRVNGARAAERTRTEANATERYQTPPNAPQGKEKGKGEYIPPISPTGEANAFEVFWAAYPRQEGEDAARKAFAKIKDVPVEVMVAAIKEQKKSRQWSEENGKYIPAPKKWLSEGHWKNSVVATKMYGSLMRRGLEVNQCES